jgi:hypothetical protein
MVIYLVVADDEPQYYTCSATPESARRKWEESVGSLDPEVRETTQVRVVKFALVSAM